MTNYIKLSEKNIKEISTGIEKIKQVKYFEKLNTITCFTAPQGWGDYLLITLCIGDEGTELVKRDTGLKAGELTFDILNHCEYEADGIRPYISWLFVIYPNSISVGALNIYSDYKFNEFNITLGANKNSTLNQSTVCPKGIENWKSSFSKLEEEEIFKEVSKHFENLKPMCGESTPDTDGQGGENGQTDKPCSNTGQFGGGGTPLKDIKLSLYANKVTKGTITLSKPQVEVGTYATDWRPNPADATKSIEMMLKQIESVRKGGRKNGKKRD